MRALHGRRTAVLTLTVALSVIATPAAASVPSCSREISGRYGTKGGQLRVIEVLLELGARGWARHRISRTIVSSVRSSHPSRLPFSGVSGR